MKSTSFPLSRTQENINTVQKLATYKDTRIHTFSLDRTHRFLHSSFKSSVSESLSIRLELRLLCPKDIVSDSSGEYRE